jgi:hypothetical protein
MSVCQYDLIWGIVGRVKFGKQSFDRWPRVGIDKPALAAANNREVPRALEIAVSPNKQELCIVRLTQRTANILQALFDGHCASCHGLNYLVNPCHHEKTSCETAQDFGVSYEGASVE